MKLVTEEELKKLSRKDCVRFALFCTEQVADLDSSTEGEKCREVVQLWLEGSSHSDNFGEPS